MTNNNLSNTSIIVSAKLWYPCKMKISAKMKEALKNKVKASLNLVNYIYDDEFVSLINNLSSSLKGKILEIYNSTMSITDLK